jgi:hypothetical protein
MRTARGSWILLALLLGLLGCGGEHPPITVQVAIHTEADPGVALSGVIVAAGETALGTSDATGSLHAQLSGELGTLVPVTATCPAGHREGRVRADVTLRPLFDVSGEERGLDVTLSCPPAERQAVLVVRAGGDAPRGGLPVWIDGREVAVTDPSGVAHVPIGMAPGASFRVELATATVAPMLRPADPATSFTFADHDDIFVFDQRFDEEQPAPTVHVHHGHHVDAPPPVDEVTRPVEIRSAGGFR